jgi:hypothetical protein
MDEERRDPDGRSADDEDPAPREVVDEQAREDEPEAAADAEDRGDHPDGDADPLARELVVDDREAEREDGAAQPLDAPERDQRPDVPREDSRRRTR